MEKEQLYQTIEAYLGGELAGEERVAFERELDTDQTLAREVALHRSLQRQLGDSAKLDLRATLDTIGKDFSESDLEPGEAPSGPNAPTGGIGGLPFWFWGLAFFLLIGGGISWYLLSAEDETISTVLPETSENMDAEEPASMTEPAEAETSESDTEPAAVEVQTEKPAGDNRPQAYDTNRELELFITDEPPSRRYEFTKGELLHNPGYITFSANLLTARSVDEGFYLSLYTNEYPEGRLFRGQLTFSEVSDEPVFAAAAKKEYVAAFTGETDLKPALYYGVVTNGNSSAPLWVGKVRVD